MPLTAKTALVTGSSQGIGLAVARAFQAAGARVVLTSERPRSDPAGRRAVEEQIPLRRIATVDDVAGWYVFLASDAAAYATGTIITVDGGLDAQQMSLRPITEGERRT